MATPTYEDLINRLVNILNEYDETPREERNRNSIKPMEYIKAIECIVKIKEIDNSKNFDSEGFEPLIDFE